MSKPRQAEESEDQIFEVELEEAQNDKDERSLKQDENLIRDQVQQTNFTNIFCNKPPSRKMSYLIVLTSHFLVGVVQAYYSVIVMELQEKKATYDDQALFSIANYPYVIKIIFAPLVDVFFFSRIGRCKTWVVFGCFLLAAIFIYISPNADADINPHNVTSLTIQWIMISFVLIIIQISFKTWILKLFDEKEVGKMAYVTHIGGLFGGFFGMNIFVPLNSVPWLNRHLFTSHPVSSPILSHRTMQLIIAFFTIGLAVFVLLFVAEKVTEVGNHKMHLRQVLKTLPRLFTFRPMRDFLIFCAAVKTLRGLFESTVNLMLIDEGMQRTTLVSVQTVLFPVTVFASLYMMRYVVKGKIMRWAYWLYHAHSLLLLFRLVIYIDLKHNHDKARTIVLLYIDGIIDKLIAPRIFLIGFIIFIAPKEIGTTFISFMYCWLNIFYEMPMTVGLKICKNRFISYEWMYFLANAIQIIITSLFKSYCYDIDTKDKGYFDGNDHIRMEGNIEDRPLLTGGSEREKENRR